jgi:hypothetical protein
LKQSEFVVKEACILADTDVAPSPLPLSLIGRGEYHMAAIVKLKGYIGFIENFDEKWGKVMAKCVRRRDRFTKTCQVRGYRI